MPRRARTTVLVVHVLAASAWIGIDVLVAVLVGVGALSSDAQARGVAYVALGSFVVVPMLVAALATLVSGVVLSVGTPWGLARHWWVLVKLVLAVAMSVAIVTALAPSMPGVVAVGETWLAGGDAQAMTTAAFPPIVSLTALSLATWLAVWKPSARTPWARPRARARAERTSAA